jgi:hypothetical protein
MTVLRQIEKTLDYRLRAAFGGGRKNAQEAIELYREVLEEVSQRIAPGPRGAPVFPFNQIRITFKVDDLERRAVLETIFQPGQLTTDIRACLNEGRASVPPDLVIEITANDEQPDEMHIAFDRVESPAAATPQAAAFIPLRLMTLAGSSSNPEFHLDADSLHIGRGPEVIDAAGRTVRRNGLFFHDDVAADGPAVNATVSRSHAHLLRDAASGDWRIYDDGSSFGTSVFRSGRRIEIPAHASRGVRLQPGDELWLGNARLRLETAPPEVRASELD